MSEWKETEFSLMLEDETISYGIVQPGFHTEFNSVPIIRVNNIKNGSIQTADILKVDAAIEEKYKRTRLKGGELLITVVGSIGECAIVPNKLIGWNVARAVSVARIKSNYDIRFIKYAFKTDDLIFQMYGNTNDTVQPTLNLSSLKTLKFNIPPLPEQEAIASVLSSLDDKIDLLHRQNATLEAMAETLFRQWFVEEAKDEWEEYKVSDIADHLKINIIPSKHSSSIFHHYSLPAFDEGKNPVSELGGGILSNKYQVLPNSILVSKLNPRFPRIWAIGPSVPDNSICSTEFQVFKPKESSLFAYLYFLFTSEEARNALTMAASGTSGSHQRVRPEDISNISFSLSDFKLAIEFSTIAQPFLNKITQNQRQIQTLTTLRDTLLPKLMSGEVRMKI